MANTTNECHKNREARRRGKYEMAPEPVGGTLRGDGRGSVAELGEKVRRRRRWDTPAGARRLSGRLPQYRHRFHSNPTVGSASFYRKLRIKRKDSYLSARVLLLQRNVMKETETGVVASPPTCGGSPHAEARASVAPRVAPVVIQRVAYISHDRQHKASRRGQVPWLHTPVTEPPPSAFVRALLADTIEGAFITKFLVSSAIVSQPTTDITPVIAKGHTIARFRSAQFP